MTSVALTFRRVYRAYFLIPIASTLLLWAFLARIVPHDHSLAALETLLASGKTSIAGKFVADSVPRHIDFSSLLSIREARFAALVRKIAPLEKNPDIHIGKLLQAALFLETEHDRAMRTKTYYFPAARSDLEYDSEYDPETGFWYVHLGHLIGKGKKKRVTKAVLLAPTHAEIVACAVQRTPMKRELTITKELRGSPGIFKIYGCTQRQENNHTVSTVFSKFYSGGSLRKLFDKKVSFSLKEKLNMAYTIIQGIEELHRRHLVHRDLGSRNYLVDITETPTGARYVTAHIADLGRTCPVWKALGTKISGNKSYTCPEGLFRDRMKAGDYYAADIYAIGCVLYQLFYDRNPEWRDSKYVKGSQPVEERYRELAAAIEKYTGSRRAELGSKGELGFEEKFEYLILTMVDPDPLKRMQAGELRENFQQLKEVAAL